MSIKDVLTSSVETLVVTFVATVLLIILGIIYFGITLYIVKVASNLFFGKGLEANWAVLSAALLTFGALLAGALGHE
ncbi:MAG: hypothetical protein GWO20_20165 [Candidatus Korarchaeota archaeon]|nr:hypothetical protein [Candidatus Korarchaeota archaeon]NIU85549.1 hypothetical protein [Candidatus Thorarchaeota archaeon]NIW15660.1 hypothetical protein [Candidatus Thorarchaeota archaeon]NIW53590.1 hypothetical protein [Candidatus Korarchaeota archaeon]